MKDTLDFWGPIIAAAPAAVANDAIFEWLSPLDRPAFERALARLERVLAWKPGQAPAKPKRKLSAKARLARDRGRKSRVIGVLFERLLRRLFSGAGAITALTNIRTTTNEIDLLLRVEPLGAQWIPMLRNAGTHLIGEAKCHAEAPSSELADEFVGFLLKQNARLGILFVNCSSRELNSACRISIAMHWKDGFEIVPIGKRQLDEVRRGAPFLRVLRDQHLLAKNHATKLAI